MLYYATHTTQAGGGIMVTGSHNPPDHNGFKMVLGGKPFFANQIQDIGRMAAVGEVMLRSGRLGDRHPRSIGLCGPASRATMTGFGLSRWYGTRGNGASGDTMTALTAMLPGRHVLLNAAIDGHISGAPSRSD